MPIVPKRMLDHITLQFSSGAEHQLAKPGELEGAHFSEIEYFVDDASGKVLGQTANPLNGVAQVLDPAKIADFIGKDFAVFAAQLADAQKALADSKAAADTAAQEKTNVDATVAAQAAQLATLTAAHAELAARNAAVAAALVAPAKSA